ncbi:hypothetical protein F2P81_024547 [Scophthalmus maximus]|uniref:Ig-like domain-containing protein n=1 Tax=Scophthalmus maximus TaxID=52904 RepID=A0A6A4RUB3_SCOMX|nr:hypothetical protein F2P81_024547 [Scophthalmus maximus]
MEGTTEQLSSVIVRAGGEVTLPCENVIRDQVECDSTDWIFSHHGKIEDLVKSGRICGESAKDKSKRLKVTENCSLVITEVTAADGGRYDCQQIKSGQQHAEDALVYLSAVKMTEDKVDDEADPEEAVCYASVSYVKKTNSEGRARVKEDEGDAVTYSAVKAASSAPADPSMSVYATVSKPEPNRDHSA